MVQQPDQTAVKVVSMRIEPQVWARLAEQYPEITVKTQANGVSVIKIDELPDVGDAGEPLPLNYQALNEALRPVIKTVPNRLHHLYAAPHFDAVKTYYWTHRWDKAFGKVYEAINNAQNSVEIVCWGFQPSMYFIRGKQEKNIGELLLQKEEEGETGNMTLHRIFCVIWVWK